MHLVQQSNACAVYNFILRCNLFYFTIYVIEAYDLLLYYVVTYRYCRRQSLKHMSLLAASCITKERVERVNTSYMFLFTF